jgi:hypothetical protein
MNERIEGLITGAEKEIATVLARLEVDTAMVVEEISLRDVEVTTFSDTRPQYIKSVAIEMLRLPGTRWDT